MQPLVSIVIAVWRGFAAASVGAGVLLSDVQSLATMAYALMEVWIASLCVVNALGPRYVDQRPIGWLLPVLYMAGLVVVPIGGGGWLGELALLVTLPFRVWCVWTLGVCCSAGPATFDEVRASGPYRFVRHPMQLSGLLSRGALCAVFPHWWNSVGFLVMVAAAVGVVLLEESFLRQFASWRMYAGSVRSRLLPGVW